MRSLPVLLLSALATILPASMGLAHATLDEAIPPVGSTVSSAPTEIRLFFTQAINPLTPGVEVDDDGRPVSTGRAVFDPADPKQLALKIPPLAAGRYWMHWHVVSADAHPLEGHYPFDIVGR